MILFYGFKNELGPETNTETSADIQTQLCNAQSSKST